MLCGLNANDHDDEENELWTLVFLKFILHFPKPGEALDRSILEDFTLEPQSGGEQSLPQYTHAWWEGTTEPLKTVVDCLVSFEQDRWQMVKPYRGKNVRPERLGLQEAKLFLTWIQEQARSGCQSRTGQLEEMRHVLEGAKLQSPESISYDGRRSLHVLDAKNYLTEKNTEVRERIRACFHELDNVTRNTREHRMFGFTPPAAEVLAKARAKAARSADVIDTERYRHNLDDPATNGVSPREIFEIGKAKRLISKKWMTNRYAPSLVYMLEDSAEVE